MNLSRRVAAAVMAALFISGCSSSTTAPQPTQQRSGKRYQLYTHCGIGWARIGGRWWRAEHPLSDGNGNPPAGWGNPFQNGTLTFTSASSARFDSAAGTVTFERTQRTRPPVICS
jgi:hypothetical protein